MDDPVKEVEKQLQALIIKEGIDVAIHHMATIICAQQNELERMNNVVDKCSDVINGLSRELASAMHVLGDHFEVEEVEDTDGVEH